jgi:hypothetical protein
MVPQSVQSKIAGDNRNMMVTSKLIRGTKLDQLVFTMPSPGKYFLRLFPSEDDQCESIGESQPFRVMSKEEWLGQSSGGKPPVAK